MNGGLFFKFIFDCWHCRTTLSISFHVLSSVFLSVDIFCGLHASDSAPCSFENIDDMFFVCCMRVRLAAILNLSEVMCSLSLCLFRCILYFNLREMCVVFSSFILFFSSLDIYIYRIYIHVCLLFSRFSSVFLFQKFFLFVFRFFSTFIIVTCVWTPKYTHVLLAGWLALACRTAYMCGIIYM